MERHRYITDQHGNLLHIQRVLQPTNRKWWQFWLPFWEEREYLVEPFSGRMTPYNG